MTITIRKLYSVWEDEDYVSSKWGVVINDGGKIWKGDIFLPHNTERPAVKQVKVYISEKQMDRFHVIKAAS